MDVVKLTKMVNGHLEQGEEILHWIQGAHETKFMGKDTVRKGFYLATDRRLIFYSKKLTGFDMEVFPYENISSIEYGKSMMGYTVSFFASGNKARMKWIKEKGVPEFTDYVKSRIGKKSSSAPTSSTDYADQIRKLAELKDAGILTDDEFQSKKSELLAKI